MLKPQNTFWRSYKLILNYQYPIRPLHHGRNNFILYPIPSHRLCPISMSNPPIEPIFEIENYDTPLIEMQYLLIYHKPLLTFRYLFLELNMQSLAVVSLQQALQRRCLKMYDRNPLESQSWKLIRSAVVPPDVSESSRQITFLSLRLETPLELKDRNVR